MDAENHPHLTDSSSSSFVRKYMTGIFLILCLIILSVFLGFSYKASSLIKEQLLRQGQAFFQEVVLTREWAADHGGVYVKLRPGMEVNPYLLKIPDLKVVIKDQDGELYTLKNPALMTREISELAGVKGIFKFKITSLKPLNHSNMADPFEQDALMRFERGEKEHFTYEQHGSQILYRYMAPLVTKKPCLKCHEQQGYREGDIRGGISVSITATEMMRQLQENRMYLIISAIGIVVLIFTIIRFISRVFINDLKQAEVKLIEMANHDFLTGLLNRREAFNMVASVVSRAERLNEPLSIIMIDIDHFKTVNDRYGHSIGDLLLQKFSQYLREMLRGYDIICRYGGEEFMVVTPATTREQAEELAERLRVMAPTITIASDTVAEPVSCTISAGIAEWTKGEHIEKAIDRADSALYRAKNEGRNRVAVA